MGKDLNWIRNAVAAALVIGSLAGPVLSDVYGEPGPAMPMETLQAAPEGPGEGVAQPFEVIPSGEDTWDLVRAGTKMAGALVLVIGLFLIGAYGVRRVLNRTGRLTGQEPMIRILSSRYIGGRNTLSVIEVEGERFIVGVSSQGIQCFTRLEGSSPKGEGPSADVSFQKVLKGKLYGK